MTKHGSLPTAHVTRTINRNSHSSFKNPWIADQYTNTVSSSASSQGVATYCTIDGPGPPCRGNGINNTRKYIHNTLTRNNNHLRQIVPNVSQSSKHPSQGTRTSLPTYSSNPNSIFTYLDRGTAENLLHGGACTTRCISHTSSDRPITPVSISTTDGVIDPCGGHCRTFERFCHYSLQVIFVIGILAGVSLVLAGYIFHGQKRGNDLLVLVYIGVLISMVCTLLLSIQCSAQRKMKRSKRRRAASALIVRNRASAEVPLRDFRASSYPTRSNRDALIPQYTNHVSQSHIDTRLNVLYCDSPLMHENDSPSVSHLRSYDEMSQSQNGIPWWRREEPKVTYKYGNIV